MKQSLNFSNRLKTLRKEKNISQQELAEEIKISRTSIGYYENEKRNPDLKILIKLADFFEVSLDFLAGKSNLRKNAEQITNEIEISDAIKEKILNSNLSVQKLDYILNDNELIKFINSYYKLNNYKSKKMSNIINDILDIVK